MTDRESELQESPSPDAAKTVTGKRILLIIGFAAVLHAAGLNSYWRVQRDSALYLGLGRSLATGEGYVFNGQPHTYALPGLPLMIAGVMRVFGPDCVPDGMLPLNIMMSLMALGCIALTYALLRELGASDNVLLATVLLVAVSRQVYYYSAQIMTDVPFTLFALMALCAAARTLRSEGRSFWLWCGATSLLTAMATLVRPFGPAILVGLVAALWLDRVGRAKWRRNLAATILLVAVLVIPLAVWTYSRARAAGPDSKSYLLWLRWGSVVDYVTGLPAEVPEFLEAVGQIVIGAGTSAVGGLVLLLIVLIGFVRLARSGSWLPVTFAAVYVGGVFMGSPGRRLLVPLVPLMFYALTLGAQAVADHLTRKRVLEAPWNSRVLIACLVVVALANLLRTADLIVENRSPRFYETLEGGRWIPYFEVARWLEENTDSEAGVLTYESNFIHLLTRRPVVAMAPATMPKKLNELRRALYSNKVRHAIADKRKPYRTAVIEELAQEQPGAVETVLEKESLTLLKIVPGKMLRKRERKQRGPQQTTRSTDI